MEIKQQEDGEEDEEKEAGIASSGPDTLLTVCGILLSTRIHIRKEKKSQNVIVGTLLKGLFNKRNSPKTIKIIFILIGHHLEEAVQSSYWRRKESESISVGGWG